MTNITLTGLAKSATSFGWLKTLARLIFKTEGVKVGQLAIAFLPAREIAEMNMQYRGKDYVPGVLSFQASGLGAEHDLGQVVLCLAALKKSATQNGNSLAQELALNLIHGVLHLLNYSHDLPEDAKLMEAKEDAYLRQWFVSKA